MRCESKSECGNIKSNLLKDLKSDLGTTLQTDYTVCLTSVWVLGVAKVQEKKVQFKWRRRAKAGKT